jgi:hypothetical protein
MATHFGLNPSSIQDKIAGIMHLSVICYYIYMCIKPAILSISAGFLPKEQGHNQPMNTSVIGMVALAIVCALKRTPGSTA